MANGVPTLGTRALRSTGAVRRVPFDVRGSSGANFGIFDDILDDVKQAGSDFIKDKVRGLVANGSVGSDSPFSDCEEGTIKVGNQCVRVDLGAAFPGGKPLVSTQPAFGTATVGSFGIPALVPAQVGTINGRPIRRCPFGAVLGKDDLCYQKGSIPRQFRKWKPAKKAPMTAADAKALRRIGTLQKKVKKLAGDAGLSCKKR